MASFAGFMLGLGQAVGGAACLIAGGPVALIAGGIIMGSGISGGINSVQQANSDKEFSWGEYTKNCLIGGVTGAITGGAGSAGATLGTKIGTEIGKKAIQVGVMSASGAVNTAVTKIINKEEITVSNCLTGAVVGAVGAGLGVACSKIPQASAVSKIVTGTASGGVSGAAAKIISNMIEEQNLSQSYFTQYLMDKEKIDQTSADLIYEQLEKNNIVRSGKINSDYKVLIAEADIQYSSTILSLLNELTSITNGVGECFLFGALSGAISSAATETAKYPSEAPKKPTTENDSKKPSTTKDGQKPTTVKDGQKPTTTNDGQKPTTITSSDSQKSTTTNDISQQESKAITYEKLVQAVKSDESLLRKIQYYYSKDGDILMEIDKFSQKMTRFNPNQNNNSKIDDFLYQIKKTTENPIGRISEQDTKSLVNYYEINKEALLQMQKLKNDELAIKNNMEQQLDTKTVINNDKKVQSQKSDERIFIKKGDQDQVTIQLSKEQMIPGYELAQKVGDGIGLLKEKQLIIPFIILRENEQEQEQYNSQE